MLLKYLGFESTNWAGQARPTLMIKLEQAGSPLGNGMILDILEYQSMVLKLEKGTALPIATVQLKTVPTVNDCDNSR